MDVDYRLLKIQGMYEDEQIEVLDEGGLDDLERLEDVRDRLTTSSFANGPADLRLERYAVRAT